MNRNIDRIFTNFAVALLLIFTATAANAVDMSGHIGGFFGGKKLKSDDWPDIDTHYSMGVIFDIQKDSWPISIVLDITDTGGKHKHDGVEDLGHTTEYHLGIRKVFERDSDFQPYIGGGVALMYAEQELATIGTTTTQDDRGVGGWVGAGMYYEINPGFVLGLDVRYSHGEVNLFDKDRNAGGIHAGITGGYRF